MAIDVFGPKREDILFGPFAGWNAAGREEGDPRIKACLDVEIPLHDETPGFDFPCYRFYNTPMRPHT
jgi:hypothetical protein